MKSRILRTLLVCAMAAGGVLSSYAQTFDDSEGQRLIGRLEDNFRLLNSLILTPSTQTADVQRTDTARTAAKPRTATLQDEAIHQRALAQINALGGRTGVDITVQGVYRPGATFGIEDNEDDLSRYRLKGMIFAQWDILKSGLVRQTAKIDEIVLQEQIDTRTRHKARASLVVSRAKERMARLYDAALAPVLELHAANLRLMDEAQRHLLERGQVSSDELMTVVSQLAEVERQLAAAAPDTARLAAPVQLSRPTDAVVMIDTAALYSRIRATNPDWVISGLRISQLDARSRQASYWHSVSAGPFVRYSYYDRLRHSNSANLDLGVSVRFPIGNPAPRTRRVLRREQEVERADRDAAMAEVMEQARLDVEQAERLNRSSQGELQRLRSLQKYLAQRANAYDNAPAGYNMLARAKEYNAYLECYERLLGFQYQRNCVVADLQRFLPEDAATDLCRQIPY